MLAVAIKIDLSKLAHPESDIRYQLPLHLESATDGLVRDDGYDYDKDGSLILFLSGDDEKPLDNLMAALCNKPFLGNRLSDAITVAVDLGPGYSVIYPHSFSGSFTLE